MRRYFGKYRGKVAANKDPFSLGRIQVEVPAILGPGRTSWAMPCTPYAGNDVGFFMIPPIGSNIWVEFEAGDPDYPIWVGCFWATNQLPEAAKVEDPQKVQVIRVEGITMTWSNLGENKGVTLEVKDPVVDRALKMVFNANGIELNNQDETTIKITATEVEVKNKANSTVTVRENEIELKQSAIVIKQTGSSIELDCNPAKIELKTTSGIEISNSPSTAKIAASGIELGVASVSTKLTPASVELSNAAASVKLSPASVNINNGALEVI